MNIKIGAFAIAAVGSLGHWFSPKANGPAAMPDLNGALGWPANSGPLNRREVAAR